MANSEIADLADALLAAAVSAYSDAGVTAPDRRYIHAGQVAFDCEQLVVSTTRVFRGRPRLPAADVNRPGDLWSVEFTLNLLRPVPTLTDRGQPPSTAKLQQAGTDLSVDARVLSLGMVPKLKAAPFDGCDLVAAGDLIPVGPEGGFGGWNLVVEVTL